LREFRFDLPKAEKMKKSARRFVVEYKNPRRKAIDNPNSIWGNLDLSSVTRQLENEALPVPDPDSAPLADANHALTQDEPTPPSLLSRQAELTTALVVEEVSMPEENEIAADVATEAEGIPPIPAEEPTPAEEPKQGRGRGRQAAAEPSGDDPSASTADKPRAKRGRPKASMNKAGAGTGSGRAKDAPRGRSALREQPVPPSSETAPDTSAPIDEMDDLLQLEQENQRLRRLLAERLREENAILRQRLGLD
jgi:hypothetical protein